MNKDMSITSRQRASTPNAWSEQKNKWNKETRYCRNS